VSSANVETPKYEKALQHPETGGSKRKRVPAMKVKDHKQTLGAVFWRII